MIILYAILGILLALFTLGSFGMMILTMVQTPGFRFSSETGRTILISAFYASITGLLAYFILWWVIHYSMIRINLYSEGFLFSQQGHKDFWHWTEVKSLLVAQTARYVKRGDSYEIKDVRILRLVIERDDGWKIDLGRSLPGLVEFSEIVMEKTYPHLIKKATQNYLAGKTVPFGGVSLNRDKGLSFHGEQLEWSQIRCIKDKAWFIEVQRNDSSRSFNISPKETPNYYILKELLKSQGLFNPTYFQLSK